MRGDVGPCPVDASQRRLEGLARRMQHGLVRREIVDEMEAADADGVTAMQFERLVALEARPLGFDGEAGDAAIALRLVGLGVGHRKTRHSGVGDPGLGAVQLPAALDLHRGHFQPAEVAADTGFAQAGAADQVALDHARQQARDMRGLAVAGKAGAGVVVIDQRKGEGEVGLGDLLEGAQLAGERQPLPAMLLGELDGVEAGRAGSLDGLQWIAPLPFPASGIRRHMLVGKSAGARHDGTFFGRQDLIQHGSEIHDWTLAAPAAKLEWRPGGCSSGVERRLPKP